MAAKTYEDGLQFGIEIAKSWLPNAKSTDTVDILQQVMGEIGFEIALVERERGDTHDGG
jgi:predicted nuclease of restriction endonuclease-like (RecB) superfamily